MVSRVNIKVLMSTPYISPPLPKACKIRKCYPRVLLFFEKSMPTRGWRERFLDVSAVAVLPPTFVKQSIESKGVTMLARRGLQKLNRE